MAKSRLVEGGRLRSPTVDEVQGEVFRAQLPEISEIKNLSPAQQWDLLQRFSVVDGWDLLESSSIEYAARIMNLSPDAARAEIENMINGVSGRNLRGQTKRAMERWSTLDMLDGQVDQDVIWVAEGDESMCENCANMDGTIGKYSDFVASGQLPGATICLGGNDCRCGFSVIG